MKKFVIAIVIAMVVCGFANAEPTKKMGLTEEQWQNIRNTVDTVPSLQRQKADNDKLILEKKRFETEDGGTLIFMKVRSIDDFYEALCADLDSEGIQYFDEIHSKKEVFGEYGDTLSKMFSEYDVAMATAKMNNTWIHQFVMKNKSKMRVVSYVD